MTFRLDLVNRAELFTHYAAWHEDGNCANPTHVAMAHHIGLLVYSVEKLFSLRKECLCQFTEFEGRLNHVGKKILFHSPGIFDLLSTFSTVLLSMRLCQNILMDVLGQKVKKSLPSSMTDYVKQHHRHRIPAHTSDLILAYWAATGRLVKDYRDVDQHFDLVARHAWIIRESDRPEVKIYLPDNPKERSAAKFAYAKEQDAFDFAADAFSQLHNLINEISVAVGYDRPGSFDYNIEFPENATECLMIIFDHAQSLLVGQEVFRSEGKHYAWSHVKQSDISRYSFLKYNSYFPMTKTFTRNYELSKDPAEILL